MTMPQQGLPPDLYEQFKRWYAQTYGALQGFALPLVLPNNAALLKSSQLQRFFTETGIPPERFGVTIPPALGPEVKFPQIPEDWLAGGGQPDEDIQQGEVVVPGELIVMPDGTYTDYLGQPVDWATAQTMLRQYNAQSLERGDQALTGAGGPQWRPGELELQQQQLALQERQWQAGLQASPRDWIERWFAGQRPQRRPSRGQAGRQLWADASPLERRALLELGGPWQISTGEREAYEQGTFPFRPGTETIARQRGWQPDVEGIGLQPSKEWWRASEMSPEEIRNLPLTERIWETLSEEEREEAISGVKGGIRKKRERAPQAPPAPAWLPQFAPGQRVGEEIKAGPIKTPSAQLWGRTPWSQRLGLAGFADFAGGRPLLDIMDEMEMMQPIRPEQRVRWQPQRRR